MNNLKDLKEKEWAQFKIADLFTITTGANIDKQLLQTGNIPRITAKETCNGIDFFSSELDIRSFKTNKNCLSVSFLGMVCYQSYRASYDMKIHSLVPKSIIFNRYTGLFVATACQMQFSKFSYGNQLSSTDLPKQRIMLPICADGTPDWQYMEDFMKAKEQKILKLTTKKLKKQLEDNRKIGRLQLQKISWKSFNFTEVFTEIQRGKRLKKDDHKKGDVPYVSSSSLNNGIDGFVGNEEGRIRRFSDCLTVANSGSVGCTFYHRYEFVASDHVTQLKRDGIDKYVYLFLIPLVQRLSEKYSFNREITDERILREKILLPVDGNGEPYWAYMAQQSREIEARLILKYLNAKIKKYEEFN